MLRPARVLTGTLFAIGSLPMTVGGTYVLLGTVESAPPHGSVAVVPSVTEPSPVPVLGSPATPVPQWSVVQGAAVPSVATRAKSALVVDDVTGDIIAGTRYTDRLPIASLTKLMTALVALESVPPDTMVTISPNAAATPPTALGLRAGDLFRVDELVAAMLLLSANDAAQAIADALGGETTFVDAMNAKAVAMGLTDTRFGNATGFDQPGAYASARDIAVVAHTFFAQYPDLAALQQRAGATLPETTGHAEYSIPNYHPLHEMEGFVAGKAGFTEGAGRCLLTIVEFDGRRLMVVLLDSPDVGGESVDLLRATLGT